MLEQKMSFFTKFRKSILDFKSYVIFQRQSTGSAIFYLFMLTLFLGTIGLIRPIVEFNKGINYVTEAIKNDVRDFTFTDGELKVEGDMPIIFDSDSEIVIIDTSGKTNKDDLIKYDKAILISKDSIIQKKNSGQISETNLNEFKSFTLNKDKVEKFIPNLKYGSILILLFGLIGFLIGKLFTALLVSLLGLIIKSIQKVNITFGTLYKISIYALTVPIIVNVLLNLTNSKFPHFYKLYCLGAAAYLWFALKEIKKEEEDMNEQRFFL